MFFRAALKVSGVGGLMSAAVLSTTRREEERERTQPVPVSSLAGVEAAVAGGEEVVGVAGVEARGREEIVAGPALLADAVKPQEQGRQAQAEKLKAAINKARNLVWCKMYESGAPGMVVAISVNGKLVWQHGFGYSDLENHLIAGTGCIMRIASISKPLTMAVLAKEPTATIKALWEEGRVELDSPVSQYIPGWAARCNGEQTEMTVRQVCCHMSGVRHYTRLGEREQEGEFDQKEYFLKDTFKTTDESLALFRDDDLLAAPGTEFHYSTHGYTVLAKIIENVTGEPFDKYMEKQFVKLGLTNTYLDKAAPIIYNRAKYYVRDEHHRLRNAPYVDNSYKWAGGGFLSNVGDLIKFGNAMLYSYQQKDVANPKSAAPPLAEPPLQVPKPPQSETAKSPEDKNSEDKIVDDNNNTAQAKSVVFLTSPYSNVNMTKAMPVRYLPGYLSSAVMRELWAGQAEARLTWGGDDLQYGLGWAVRPASKQFGFCQDQHLYLTHTGGAVGASSVLLVAPRPAQDGAILPQGVVVAILCNMQGVGLNKLASDIATTFQGLELEKPAKVHKVYQC